MAYTSTKTFDCISTAHRNWRARNNPSRDSRKCAYIHGYTKTFTFVFGCSELDDYQWVQDYGTSSSNPDKPRTMTLIKQFIQDDLDHGVTTDSHDPMLLKLKEMHDLELIKLIVIPVENGQSGSVEGLCRYLFNRFDPLLQEETGGRCWIQSITVSEHHKNSSTYTREDDPSEKGTIYIDLGTEQQSQPNKETVDAMNEDVSKEPGVDSIGDLFDSIFGGNGFADTKQTQQPKQPDNLSDMLEELLKNKQRTTGNPFNIDPNVLRNLSNNIDPAILKMSQDIAKGLITKRLGIPGDSLQQDMVKNAISSLLKSTKSK